MAGRQKARASQPRRRKAEQIELFPEPVQVERLDPHRLTGGSTSIVAVYRVIVGYGGEAHLVYHDRHGVYCEVHGRECRAVRAVATQ